MDFNFSLAWLFGGIALVIVGILMVRYYKQIADNLMSGVSSYGHLRLAALITIGVGIAAATNLIPLILALIKSTIFSGV